jgi:5-formyltetrahydrofolate cyclo-ligase
LSAAGDGLPGAAVLDLPAAGQAALISAVKKSLRKMIRERLATMNPAVAHAKSMAACRRLVAQPEFERAKAIMIYLPMPDEVDLTPVALRGWQEQKIIAAPRISWDRRHMIPIEIRSLESVVEGRRGLREPGDGEPVPLQMLDLVVVPALAYDRRGNRLGRGAGFYDRFLASPTFRGVATGLAFREQLTEDVPVCENDVPVHMLVTDEEVLRFTPAVSADEGTDAGR